MSWLILTLIGARYLTISLLKLSVCSAAVSNGSFHEYVNFVDETTRDKKDNYRHREWYSLACLQTENKKTQCNHVQNTWFGSGWIIKHHIRYIPNQKEDNT